MRALLPLSLAAALALPLLPQQEPPGLPEEESVIKVDVDVVNILCSVRDKSGRLIPNLTKDDFEIYEDGKPQEIRYFARESDLPLTIGLLVDVSKSQETLIGIEKQAAARFFADVLRKKDLAFLISFGADAELLQDLTGSPEALRRGLEELRLNAGAGGIHPGPVPTARPRGTILYDAVYLAAEDRLRREVGRKAIVVITDGVDVGSRIDRSGAIEAAQKSDAIVYSIYYADPNYQYMANGFGDLKKMSEETGGRVLRVTRKAPLETIFKDIQEEMRSQYSIGYIPANPAKDGSFRKIEIRLKEKGLKAQARKGYYASRQS
ncbi:MAG: VWA domain-containing protein [Bryobacteraceae bacterium]|nr:VWA domain-containing protein [Bryobacteraceae bacterium]